MDMPRGDRTLDASADMTVLRPPSAPPVQRISPAGQHCFFGYYDLPCVDAGGTRHLMHRVAFRDRLPRSGDIAEIGMVHLDALGAFVPIDATRAWNFQQGSGLQWLGDGSGRVFYNDVNAPGRYHGVLRDPLSPSKHYTDRALAHVSRDARWGLAVNFDRLYDFRAGYGYFAQRDPWADVPHPTDDGIWLCDLSTGQSELVVSLACMHRELGPRCAAMNGKLLVNHLSFNPSGTRFVFLVRNFPAPDAPEKPGGRWYTSVMTASRDGTGLRLLVAPGYASHYHWRDDTTLAFHCDGPAGVQLYEVTDSNEPRFTALDPKFFRRDGHCSYDPTGRLLLYDSYPDADKRQHLYVYDRLAHEGHDAGAFAALPVPVHDVRCDLHPRWLSEGRISLDSTHEGYRGVYVVGPVPGL